VVEYMSRVYGFARLPRDKVRADLRRAIFDAAAQDLAPPKGGEAPISSA
jgi:hypothetical protein